MTGPDSCQIRQAVPAENAELRMERDVLKRSVLLWVKGATKMMSPIDFENAGGLDSEAA